MTLARPALVVTAQKEVPLWVIILSVCAGILLLIILIIILWRVRILLLFSSYFSLFLLGTLVFLLKRWVSLMIMI